MGSNYVFHLAHFRPLTWKKEHIVSLWAPKTKMLYFGWGCKIHFLKGGCIRQNEKCLLAVLDRDRNSCDPLVGQRPEFL